MNRTLPVLGGGVLLGMVATLAFVQTGQPGDPKAGDVVRDIADIPQMTEAVAQKHRDEHYANLVSIEKIIALPTGFARLEAAHVLAGRSDAAQVQKLIFEANRISDDIEREALLNILFYRLAETDPQSALALARMDQFVSSRSLERTVWRGWARKDLDDALFAARTQTTQAQQRLAARSLYEAFGHMGNEVTDRIESELGIKPDLWTRGQYLYNLADRSPPAAVEYINAQEEGQERVELASRLAYYLGFGSPNDALQYADLFESPSDRFSYRSVLERMIAREDPTTAIEEMLAGSADRPMWNAYDDAISDLAGSDLEAVKRYYEQARSKKHRRDLGRAIVIEMAKDDPAEALDWARANDRGDIPTFQFSALGVMAKTDPQLALSEAFESPDPRMHRRLLSVVIDRIAMADPASATSYLERIEDPQQRLEASEELASTWAREDVDAAAEWMLSLDKETSGRLMMVAASELIGSDIDAAIRLLPNVGDEHQAGARRRIAQELSETRSIEETQAFLQQYQGEPDYEQLQATVVSGIARNDTLMARQFVEQIQDPSTRDLAFVQVIEQHATTDPAEAYRWLDNVSNAALRRQGLGHVTSHWYAQDPTAATQWVSSLPRGPERDDAILSMASDWKQPTSEQDSLIASIDDRNKRGQAKIRHIFSLMRSDPDKARALLQDEDISDAQREKVKETIAKFGLSF